MHAVPHFKSGTALAAPIIYIPTPIMYGLKGKVLQWFKTFLSRDITDNDSVSERQLIRINGSTKLCNARFCTWTTTVPFVRKRLARLGCQ